MQEFSFTKDAWPDVSIILLSRNGLPELAEGLRQIQDQDYPGAVEIVHIDTDSTDGTLEAVAACGIESHGIAVDEFHHGRTRNLGVDMARHEIVVFLSQDAVPQDQHWLRALVAPFADPQVAGVFGKQEAPASIGSLRRYALSYTYPEEREVRALATTKERTMGLYRFSNANSALRKAVCQAIRFEEHSPMCEDQAMCRDMLKAGHQIVYEPDAAVWHAHERSLWQEFQWAADNGVALKQNGILDDPDLGSAMRYGLDRIRTEFLHFLIRGRIDLALHGFVINVVKWIGVQFGKRVETLPNGLMHRIAPSVKKIS